MAKKMCDLCQLSPKKEIRFGVALCENCLKSYTNAMFGDTNAMAYLSNPANFPNATDAAREGVVKFMAERAEKTRVETIPAVEIPINNVNAQQQQIPSEPVFNRWNVQPPKVAYVKKNVDTQSFFDRLYDNIGGKIKSAAKAIFIFEAITSILAGIILFFIGVFDTDDEFVLIGPLLAIFGPIVAWVSSWLIYAFGELVEKTAANERNTRNILNILKEDHFKNN